MLQLPQSVSGQLILFNGLLLLLDSAAAAGLSTDDD
jgi:hypothetical protein